MSKDISEYFWEHYTNKDMCSLCGQIGIIDTRGIKTPAGVEVGRLNWCICPNGMAMRDQSKSLPSEALLEYFRR